MELQRRQRNFVAVEEGVGIDEVAVTLFSVSSVSCALT